MLSRLFYAQPLSRAIDIELLVAMVEKSAQIFEERYQGEFYCLLWNEMQAEKGIYLKILKKLKEKKIKVIEIEEIMPGYTKNYERYPIYIDKHPNVKSHEIISKYLADFLNRKNRKLFTGQ